MSETNQYNFGAVIPAAMVFGGVLLAGAYFIPWSTVDWGSVHQVPGKTIMVVGESQTQKINQTASLRLE